MIRKVGAKRGPTTQQAPHEPLSPRPRGATAARDTFRLDAPTVRSTASVKSRRPAQQIAPPKVFEDMETRRRQIDQMIARAMRGEQFSAGNLLVWQARVYAYSQQIDIFSKVVDRTVSALKTTLNTQT